MCEKCDGKSVSTDGKNTDGEWNFEFNDMERATIVVTAIVVGFLFFLMWYFK